MAADDSSSQDTIQLNESLKTRILTKLWANNKQLDNFILICRCRSSGRICEFAVSSKFISQIDCGLHVVITVTDGSAYNDICTLDMDCRLVPVWWFIKHNICWCYQYPEWHGTLTRYVKLRVAHALGMPGTFSPPPTSKETASSQSRHASRHVRHAPVVMHIGIANPLWRGQNVPGIPGACATRNFTYLARGPW